MATLDQLSAALVKADAAGNVDDARALAAEIRKMRTATPAAKKPGLLDSAIDFAKKDIAAIPGRVGNLVAGGVRGAGSIGATVLAPKDIISDAIDGKGLTLESNRKRRADMTGGLQAMGADPSSAQFQAGKIGAEIAGTMGAGGAVANGVRLVPGLGPLASAIQSGGFNLGTQGGNQVVQWLTRLAGGGINGGVQAGLADPDQAGMGATIGTALPPVAKLAGAAGNFVSDKVRAGAKSLMQSAIKPTLPQRASGEADTAINTLLELGINPNASGVNKLRGMIDSLDNQLTADLANSTAVIDKQKVLNRLAAPRSKFTTQVTPVDDLAAIQRVEDGFAAHPSYPGATIPVQDAQALKRGTYKVIGGKFGEQGSAATEAQKALALGLKEEIASAVPSAAPLNAEMSKLITTLDVAERRALLELNKNPVGLTALANDPKAAALFLVDRSAIFKSLLARMMNSSAGGAGGAFKQIGNSASNPLIRNVLSRPLATSENTP